MTTEWERDAIDAEAGWAAERLTAQAEALVTTLAERAFDIEGDYYAEPEAMDAAERRYVARLHAATARAIARLVRRGGDDPYERNALANDWVHGY
jgi:predicted NAD/FAD-dependent oxidoreductase